MREFWIVLTFLIVPSFVFSQSEKKNGNITSLEREAELLDFKSIRNVLRKDKLQGNAEKTKEKVKKVKKKRKQRIVNKYDFPKEKDFWKIMSEHWLVENATVLKWNFKKPDYGVGNAFKVLLEKLGHFEVKFNVLYLDTPNIFHTALPYPDGEYLFLVSVPFVRTLDLTKLEISILLYEDFLRAKNSYFKQKVADKEIKDKWGTNFYNEDFDKEIFDKISRNYDKVVFEKGFTFKEQFSITKKMDAHFKNEQKLWNTYYGLLKKIKKLVENNLLYSEYPKIYPSPELQIGWLEPDSGNQL